MHVYAVIAAAIAVAGTAQAEPGVFNFNINGLDVAKKGMDLAFGKQKDPIGHFSPDIQNRIKEHQGVQHDKYQKKTKDKHGNFLVHLPMGLYHNHQYHQSMFALKRIQEKQAKAPIGKNNNLNQWRNKFRKKEEERHIKNIAKHGVGAAYRGNQGMESVGRTGTFFYNALKKPTNPNSQLGRTSSIKSSASAPAELQNQGSAKSASNWGKPANSAAANGQSQQKSEQTSKAATTKPQAAAANAEAAKPQGNQAKQATNNNAAKPQAKKGGSWFPSVSGWMDSLAESAPA